MVNLKLGGFVICAGVAACNVSSPHPSTGGVAFDTTLGTTPDASGLDGATGEGADGGASDGGSTTSPDVAVATAEAAAPPTCESGLVVVTSDYMSTNIAVSKLDGTTLSGSFVSSGAKPPGLALALSGDVDVPFVAPASGRLVLLDRYGTNVITWMDVAKASVITQLAVGTGFESNPQDYIEVDASRAFVSRYGTNPNPGQMPFDQGGDVLVVDTTAPTIAGRIAIPEEDPALQPCPSAMTWIGHEVVVTLGRFSKDFSKEGDGRFLGISPTTSAIDWTVDIAGLQNCGRIVVSPSGTLAAIACSSKEDATAGTYDPTMSDIVIYDATQTPPKELRRLGLGVKLGVAIQPTIAFASEDALLATTYGSIAADGGAPAAGDSAFAVSTTTGAVTPLAQAAMSFVFGGLRCSAGCGDVCLLCDAERSKLRRWQFANGMFTALEDVTVDTVVGLPPRDLGGLR